MVAANTITRQHFITAEIFSPNCDVILFWTSRRQIGLSLLFCQGRIIPCETTSHCRKQHQWYILLKRITLWSVFACKYIEWKVSNDTPGYCTFGFRYVFYISTKPVLLFLWVYLIYSVFFLFFNGIYNLKTKLMSKTKTPILWHIFGNIYSTETMTLRQIKKNPVQIGDLSKLTGFLTLSGCRTGFVYTLFTCTTVLFFLAI